MRLFVLPGFFSNVFPRHLRRELGRWSFGSDPSVRPGLGIGKHLADFHSFGNTL